MFLYKIQDKMHKFRHFGENKIHAEIRSLSIVLHKALKFYPIPISKTLQLLKQIFCFPQKLKKNSGFHCIQDHSQTFGIDKAKWEGEGLVLEACIPENLKQSGRSEMLVSAFSMKYLL